MRKKSPIFTVVLTILILILGYFAYQQFVQPVYLGNEMQVETIDLRRPQPLILTNQQLDKNVFEIEIEITGTANENLDITVANGNSPVHKIALKNGEIDYVYKADWYTDSCFLNVQSRSADSGALRIEYRFLATGTRQ